MKIQLALICSFLWFCGAFTGVLAQDFFPLETGNLWSYDVYNAQGTHYTSNMKVTGDTTLSNGNTYYALNNYDPTLGPFVRVDSQFIYFVMENDTAEMPLYMIDARVGDSMHVNWGAYSYVYLTGIDSLTLFDSATVVYTFLLDGLVVSQTKLSKDFGPVSIEHYGDPPSPFPVWRYQLSGCIISGNVHGVINSLNGGETAKPNGFELQQNYPNPFNPTTVINWQTAVGSHVELAVYNLLGQRVRTLVNGKQPAGVYRVEWDGRDDAGKKIASGIYIYRLQTSEFVSSRKMLLLR